MPDGQWEVKESTRRYAEELRSNPGKASRDTQTDWTCDAGASLLAWAMTPGPGKIGTLHGVIYVCPNHRADAEKRITDAGYNPDVDEAPPGHRWSPWPCGHVTAHSIEAADKLQESPAQDVDRL